MYQFVCSEDLKLVDNLQNHDQQKYSKSIAALHPPCFSGLWKGFYGLLWISWVVKQIRQGNTCYSVLPKKYFSTNVFCRLKKLWTICPFYPQNLLKGFSKQSRYSVEYFFSMFILLSRVRKINWHSFWWCQCVLCYASFSSKYFLPLLILYKNVTVFLFTASVKDQFISTWFTYSCVTQGNVLKVTDKYYCPFNYTILHQLMKCITVNLITFLCVSALTEGLKEGWLWWH